MYKKSQYSGEYFDSRDALWPEKWTGTEEGLMVYLDIYNLKPETIDKEKDYYPEAAKDKVIVFKIQNSEIIRIIRLSYMLGFARKSNVIILEKISDKGYVLRNDLIIRLSERSMVFLNK